MIWLARDFLHVIRFFSGLILASGYFRRDVFAYPYILYFGKEKIEQRGQLFKIIVSRSVN